MPKLVNPKGRLRWANVQFVSFVGKGANGQPLLIKDAEQLDSLDLLCKADPLKGEVTTIVMVKDRTDAHGMGADAEAIRSAAHSFAGNGFQLDLRHNGRALSRDEAHVVESFIIQKGDERFADWKDDAGAPVDATGSWAIIYKVKSPALLADMTAGKLGGVSIYGEGLVELAKAADDELAERLLKRLRGETSVDETKMAAMIDAALTKHVGQITSRLSVLEDASTQALLKKQKDGEAPKFTGDPTDLKALAAHRLALERHALVKSVDLNDPVAIAELEKKLSAASGGETPEQKLARLEKAATDAKAAQAAAEAALAEVKKGSLQPAGGTPSGGGGGTTISGQRDAARDMLKRYGALAGA